MFFGKTKRALNNDAYFVLKYSTFFWTLHFVNNNFELYLHFFFCTIFGSWHKCTKYICQQFFQVFHCRSTSVSPSEMCVLIVHLPLRSAGRALTHSYTLKRLLWNRHTMMGFKTLKTGGSKLLASTLDEKKISKGSDTEHTYSNELETSCSTKQSE